MWRRLRYALALIGLCAIATCPAARRSCTAKQRAREAHDLLQVLGDRVAAHVAATGRVPPTAAPLTPRPACCEQGGTCSPDASTWSATGWRELEFTIDDPYRFAYEYAPDPSGHRAIVRAVGDLDCDDHPSTYELVLTVKGSEVERAWSHTHPQP
jgi:hypothetical protein